MKKIQGWFYLIGALVMPWVALAHNGVDDGDGDVSTPHPEQRMQVLAGVGVVAALVGGFIWYSHRKNMPSVPEENEAEKVS